MGNRSWTPNQLKLVRNMVFQSPQTERFGGKYQGELKQCEEYLPTAPPIWAAQSTDHTLNELQTPVY